MTPDQNARLHALVPQIVQLDALGRALAEVEDQLRKAEDLLAPWARQLHTAEEEIRSLSGFGWSSLAATFSGKKQRRLEAAQAAHAEAEQQIKTAQEKLKPLQKEAQQIEAKITPLKPMREEYEQLLRTKEAWLKKQPEAKQRWQQLQQLEEVAYRAFIVLDSTLIAVQRVESAMNDLRQELDTERRGDIGREAVPLIKNLRDILMNFGPAYMRELTLVDRCYAYAAQSARLMLEQDEQGRQLIEQVRHFGKQMAADFVQARDAWRDAQRQRIQYVESYPVT